MKPLTPCSIGELAAIFARAIAGTPYAIDSTIFICCPVPPISGQMVKGVCRYNDEISSTNPLERMPVVDGICFEPSPVICNSNCGSSFNSRGSIFIAKKTYPCILKRLSPIAKRGEPEYVFFRRCGSYAMGT